MEQLEKVEKIREKLSVSYEEAKRALEACNWDILDAIVYLEQLGKVAAPSVSTYSTKNSESEEFRKASDDYEKSSRHRFGQLVNSFFKWCGKVIKLGCDSSFEVYKNGKNIMCIPVIVVVVLLMISFWVTLPLIVVGLFFNFRYTFTGPIAGANININDVCSKATEACENIKNDFSEKKDSQE